MKKLLTASVALLFLIGCGGGSSSDDSATSPTTEISTPNVKLAPLNEESATDLLHAYNTELNIDNIYFDYIMDDGIEGLNDISSCDNDGNISVVKNSETDYVINASKCLIDEDYYDGSIEIKCETTECKNVTLIALTDVWTSDNVKVNSGFVENLTYNNTVNAIINGEFANDDKNYKVENLNWQLSFDDESATFKILNGRYYINNLQNYVDFDKMIEDFYYEGESHIPSKGEVAFKADGGDINIAVQNGNYVAIINGQVVASEPIVEDE
ncbi:MAG: hypothetical protein GXO62_00510 [Epsilonproteobacteria bacterium]|nr:hypothetical protein [Campylobacterota bacterium]